MRILGLICARGGSKGLPGKNIRPIAGKPLIAWAIEQARAVARVGRPIVSTDSEEIAAVARQWGAEVPFMRPAELARDDSPELLAWRHALCYVRDQVGSLPDALAVIPATAPLRLPQDIEACLDEFTRSEADLVLTVSDAHNNPYFNMIRKDKAGYVHRMIASAETPIRRQDAPIAYNVTTVAYVSNPRYILNCSELLAGRVRAVHIPPERAFDIDTLLDFRIAEWLMTQTVTGGSAPGLTTA